ARGAPQATPLVVHEPSGSPRGLALVGPVPESVEDGRADGDLVHALQRVVVGADGGELPQREAERVVDELCFDLRQQFLLFVLFRRYLELVVPTVDVLVAVTAVVVQAAGAVGRIRFRHCGGGGLPAEQRGVVGRVVGDQRSPLRVGGVDEVEQVVL